MNEGLKQRVIGALVLLGIAIIFLPSFFRERQPYQVDMTSQIPARPDITPLIIEDPVRPLGIDPAPAPETMYIPDSDQTVQDSVKMREAVEAEVSTNVAVITEATLEDTTDSVITTPAAVSENNTVDNNDPSALPEGVVSAWVIQVASLRKVASARTLKDDLQGRGYRAYIRQVQTAAGPVSRVFIGPKLDKQAALSIKAKVDLIFKVNSLVLAFKP